MAGISVSGLISNSFDWKSVVDQLIQIDSAPIARLQSEQAENNNQLASFATLRTKMAELQSAAKTLASGDLFAGRTAASATTGSTWTATAANSATNGNYTFAVTQLATASSLRGATPISSPISSSPDVSAVTVSTMPLAKAITAGTFTVNGKTIKIEQADLAGTFQDLLGKISAATGNVVQATYVASRDAVQLTTNGGADVVLGAANDTSNFLAALRLANNGTDTVESSGRLGTPSLTAPLKSGRLANPYGTVNEDGTGQFLVNGVPIDYDVDTDSISTLLTRITSSSAGVTATYDSAGGGIILTNKTTGNVGVAVEDKTGLMAQALGLTTGATFVAGQNAEFSINGGGTLSSYSNTLDASVTGISGLTVTVNTETTQTINVKPNTAAMRTAIEDFIADFNSVQNFIESETAIEKGADGKVATATLAKNHEVQNWSSELRRMVFAEVPGLSGAVKRLENLGIDFDGREPTLVIKNASKLDNALANNTADVGAFFGTLSSGGLGGKINDYLTTRLESDKGALAIQTKTLNKSNTSIQDQIDALNRRLVSERERLTNAFLLMQTAQSQASQQQKALTDMMKSNSSSSSS